MNQVLLSFSQGPRAREAQAQAPRRRKCSQPLKVPRLSSTARLYLQVTFSGDAPGCGEELAELHPLASQKRHWTPWKRTV